MNDPKVHLNHTVVCHVHRGVTRLDGARGKKQVWRPHVRNWGLSEANLLFWRKYLRHYWDFSAPQQWFGAWEIVPPSLRPCLYIEIVFKFCQIHGILHHCVIQWQCTFFLFIPRLYAGGFNSNVTTKFAELHYFLSQNILCVPLVLKFGGHFFPSPLKLGPCHEVSEDLLLCKALQSHIKAKDIFRCIDNFSNEHSIQGECVGTCTGGAAACTGENREYCRKKHHMQSGRPRFSV